jgi:glycosyltransferase involved in cell wall biosynthesis
MGVGRPPVAFASSPGTIEILEDGAAGLLVPPTDAAALATAICSLIEDPARRAELGATARRCVEKYSAAAVDDQWEQLLTELVSRPPGARRR